MRDMSYNYRARTLVCVDCERQAASNRVAERLDSGEEVIKQRLNDNNVFSVVAKRVRTMKAASTKRLALST